MIIVIGGRNRLIDRHPLVDVIGIPQVHLIRIDCDHLFA